jgi:hypothetical protein
METLRYTALAANREGELFSRDWIDIDTPSATIESDAAVHQCKNRVIATESNVLSGHKLCAALADNDVAGDDHLAAKSLDAETFADAVAAVLDATLSFFVSHLEEVELLGVEKLS